MEFTHFNQEGRARMVDVSEKEVTPREAEARAVVRVNAETYEKICAGTMKKGDVLGVAQVAGIMAAKHTSDLIPMCHPIQLTGVDLSFSLDDGEHTITVTARTRCKGETGVEMEAKTAASAAALTNYDMCKAVQRDIVIESVCLVSKSGGKSGNYRREETEWQKS